MKRCEQIFPIFDGIISQTHQAFVNERPASVSASIENTPHCFTAPGLQRGMMGSNNHIVTGCASASSHVKRNKGSMRSSHSGPPGQPRRRTRSRVRPHMRAHKHSPGLMKHRRASQEGRFTHTHTHTAGCLAAKTRGSASAQVLPSQVKGHPIHWKGPESAASRWIARSLRNNGIDWHAARGRERDHL